MQVVPFAALSGKRSLVYGVALITAIATALTFLQALSGTPLLSGLGALRDGFLALEARTAYHRASSLKTQERRKSMALELPAPAYAYDALGALYVERNAGISPRQAPSGLCHQWQTTAEGFSARLEVDRRDLQGRPLLKRTCHSSTCRPALQPHPLLELDEAQLAAARRFRASWKRPSSLTSAATTRFRTDFVQAGVTQFGSGLAWLSVKDGKLAISTRHRTAKNR